MKKYVGIDLGGTKTKIGLVYESGDIIESRVIDTLSYLGINKTLERIWEVSKEILKDNKVEIEDLDGIGIGIPGPVKNESIVTFFSNFDWEENVNLAEKFEKISGIKTKVGNDVNVIAQGEVIFGVAQGCSSSVVVAIGTGIGGGIFINGKLLSGVSGVSGEIGHMKIVKDGKICGCGQKGCFEAYASTNSLIREAIENFQNFKNRNSLIFESVDGNFSKIDGKLIFDVARKGDKYAKQLIDNECEYLAIGIGNLINILNPEMIVICGGISYAGNDILLPLKEKLKKYAMPPALKDTKIVIGILGNEAGIKGSIGLFM